MAPTPVDYSDDCVWDGCGGDVVRLLGGCGLKHQKIVFLYFAYVVAAIGELSQTILRHACQVGGYSVVISVLTS